MNKVLVTGGCGYIGSHTIVDLIQHGFSVVSIDNLINGDITMLDGIEKITGKRITNYEIDLCHLPELEKIFIEHPDIRGIIHFAALKSVGDSVNEPLLYYHNNIEGLINLLLCQKKFQLENLIFSSSCSVYGNAKKLPVDENTPIAEAESPYARTKQIAEDIIQDFSNAYEPFRAIVLRYFNPAGAHASALIGESSINPPTNLVPVITETAAGKRPKMMVYGDDYPTRDGSCIRDYIYIMDLARAHTKALQHLLDDKIEKNVDIFNLGSGTGVSVLEAIHAFEKSTNTNLNYEIGPRREGDVVAVYADFSKAKDKLGWIPEHSIDHIMETAWAWEQVK